MDIALVSSYVVHVTSAALWTGATLYFVYSWYIIPHLRDDSPPDAVSFVASADALLRVTRWTGIALPVTGAYLILRLYSLDALVGTARGSLVLVMAATWGSMNGIMETGVFRMRRLTGEIGVKEYMLEGFPPSYFSADRAESEALRDTGSRYMLVAAVLAVVLLIDAAVLSSGAV